MSRGIFYFYVRYSTLLHLPPLRFHCVGGRWDRTQVVVVYTSCSIVTQTQLHSHPNIARRPPASTDDPYSQPDTDNLVTPSLTNRSFSPIMKCGILLVRNVNVDYTSVGAQSRQSAGIFLLSSELGLPLPLACSRVCPPPSFLGDRAAHSLAGEGVGGGSQFRRGDRH
jgi:hypothetical protein